MVTLNDAIVEHKIVGPCSIDINIAIKTFTKKCSISRWHNEYRLIRIRNKRAIALKVTIFSKDAKELIKRLDLEEYKSPIFTHASTFKMKEKRNSILNEIKKEKENEEKRFYIN